MLSKVIQWLRGTALTLGRAVRSKTVLTAVAGFAIHFAVRKNWIPDSFFTQAIEGLAYVLCAVFRVVAVKDLQTGGALAQAPSAVPQDVETVGAK